MFGNFLKKKSNLKILVFIFLLIFLKISSSINSDLVEENESKNLFNEVEKTSQIDDSQSPLNKEQEEEIQLIYVDVKGAVKTPGLYQVSSGSRIGEVIKKAGGFENANEQCLNLAQKVNDEELLTILSENEKCEKLNKSNSQKKSENEEKLTTISGKTQKIDLNTATIDELQMLKGIGENRAKDIIEYRDTVSTFKDVTEIKNVTGIGEGIYKKIESQIEV